MSDDALKDQFRDKWPALNKSVGEGLVKRVLRDYFLGYLTADATSALQDVTDAPFHEAHSSVLADIVRVDNLRRTAENAKQEKLRKEVTAAFEYLSFHDDGYECDTVPEGLEHLKEVRRRLDMMISNIEPPSPLVKECDPELERILAEEDVMDSSCSTCSTIGGFHRPGCEAAIEGYCDEFMGARQGQQRCAICERPVSTPLSSGWRWCHTDNQSTLCGGLPIEMICHE